MATQAKRPRRNVRADSATTEELQTGDSASESSSRKKPCIICGGSSTSKIVRDQYFDTMIQLYWKTIGVDVKPEASRKLDICRKCFGDLVKFSETNDINLYFETYFRSLRLELLRKTLKGIKSWEKNGHPLTRIHQEIREGHGDKADFIEREREEEQIKQILSSYNAEVVTTEEVGEESNGTEGKKTVKRNFKLKRKEDEEKTKSPKKS